MVELLKNLDIHKEKNDLSVCFKLCNYIIDNNINSESELKEKEDSNFSTADLKQRNIIRFNEFLMDRTHLETYDQNVIYELELLRKEIESNDDELYKTRCLIKIHTIIDWEFIFPYTAYKLIISDKLN